MTDRQRGIVLVALAASSFGVLPMVARGIYATSDLRPTDVAIWRMGLAFVALAVWVAWRQGREGLRPPLPLWQHALMGLTYGGAVLGAFFALDYIPGSLFSVLVFCYPAMVALISLALGVRISAAGWAALGLTLLGVVLTVPSGDLLTGANLTGVLITFATALCAALYFIVSSRFMRISGEVVLTGTLYMIGFMVLFFLLLIVMFGFRWPPLHVWPHLLFLSIGCTVLAFIALNAGIRRIGAPEASILGSFEPMVSMVMGSLIVGEVLTQWQWVGAALIIVAVVVLQVLPAQPRGKLA
jgi:drug/metabolite transporter (DMT)-like permease